MVSVPGLKMPVRGRPQGRAWIPREGAPPGAEHGFSVPATDEGSFSPAAAEDIPNREICQLTRALPGSEAGRQVREGGHSPSRLSRLESGPYS